MQQARNILHTVWGLFCSVQSEEWRHFHCIFRKLKALSITDTVAAWAHLYCPSASVLGFMVGMSSHDWKR